jgi:acyl carrier protein
MLDLTPRLIAILEQYMCVRAAPVTSGTALSDLEIDLLDLPMILLDIEDAFAVHIRYDDKVEDFITVGDLVACVASHLEAKSLPRAPTAPRVKRLWTSTGAEHRR